MNEVFFVVNFDKCAAVLGKLSKYYTKDKFDCGDENLNIFLKKYALQKSKQILCRNNICNT
jgi:hypothetical protein